MPSSEVPLIRPTACRRFMLEERTMSSASQHRSTFLAAAAERGYIHQCTDFAALDARLAAGPGGACVG